MKIQFLKMFYFLGDNSRKYNNRRLDYLIYHAFQHFNHPEAADPKAAGGCRGAQEEAAAARRGKGEKKERERAGETG